MKIKWIILAAISLVAVVFMFLLSLIIETSADRSFANSVCELIRSRYSEFAESNEGAGVSLYRLDAVADSFFIRIRVTVEYSRPDGKWVPALHEWVLKVAREKTRWRRMVRVDIRSFREGYKWPWESNVTRMNSVVPISTNSLVTDARDEPEFITNSTLRVSTISCNPEEYHDKVIRIIGYYLVEHEKSVLLNGGKPYDSRGIWVSGRPPLTSISDTIKWGKVPGFVEIVGLFSSKHNPQYLEMGEYVGEITRLVSGRYLMNDEAEHLGLHIAYASNVVINGSAEMSPTP